GDRGPAVDRVEPVHRLVGDDEDAPLVVDGEGVSDRLVGVAPSDPAAPRRNRADDALLAREPDAAVPVRERRDQRVAAWDGGAQVVVVREPEAGAGSPPRLADDEDVAIPGGDHRPAMDVEVDGAA